MMLNLDNLPAELLPFKENILATLKPVIEITLSPAKDLALWASKVGGKPYLPLDVDYPHNEKGEPLGFLAQFNLAELPKTDELPPSGILSFFVNMDEFESKVFYFENVTKENAQLQQNFDEIFIRLDESILPFEIGNEYAVSFQLSQQIIGAEDFYFAKKVFGGELEPIQEIPRKDEYTLDLFGDDPNLSIKPIESPSPNREKIQEIIYQSALFDSDGHHLLGYPYFTQNDPRDYGEISNNTILLFQLDTDEKNGVEIMWGDTGVGNFFIHPEDLKNKDFSKVAFYWDCC